MGRQDYEDDGRGWVAALKQAARRLVARAFPTVDLAALEMDAARFVASEIPQLFSRNLRQIDPSLNDELLELYSVAEQVLANRFTYFNRAHEFAAAIDWRFRESRDWLGELHAFDFALPLAMTYRISGEERYARHLRHLVAHWIAENPPLRGPGWWPAPLARRVRNWILAADLARADWEHDAEFFDVVSRSLALQTADLVRHSHAPRTLDEIRALLLAGRFFSPELQAAAGIALARVLKSLPGLSATPQVYIELAATILEFLLFGTGKTEELKIALRDVLRILEGILLADGSLPLFGAPSLDDFADVTTLGAVVLADPTWKRLGGSFGILPYLFLGEDGKARFEGLPDKPWKAENRILPESGYGRLCGVELSAVVVNVPTDSPAKARARLATFELAIQAQRVVVDTPGRSEDDEHDDARAHNVFLVEQSRPASGRRATVKPSDEKLGFESGDRFAGIRWAGGKFGKVCHQRAWYCLDSRYWVVLDQLEGKGFASGASLLHFYPTFEIELLADRVVARSRVLTVMMIPFGRNLAEMTVSRGDDGEFPGWYAPGLGVKYAASVLAVRWRSVHLPWMGGLVIIPGTEALFRAAPPDRERGIICLELASKRYELPL